MGEGGEMGRGEMRSGEGLESGIHLRGWGLGGSARPGTTLQTSLTLISQIFSQFRRKLLQKRYLARKVPMVNQNNFSSFLRILAF